MPCTTTCLPINIPRDSSSRIPDKPDRCTAVIWGKHFNDAVFPSQSDQRSGQRYSPYQPRISRFDDGSRTSRQSFASASSTIEKQQTFDERSHLSLRSDLRELSLEIVCRRRAASSVDPVCDVAEALDLHRLPAIETLKGFTKLRKVRITLQSRNLPQATDEQKQIVTTSVSKVLTGCVTNLHVNFTQANDTGKSGMKATDMAARIRQEAYERMERRQANGAIGALRAFPWIWEGV